MRPRSAITSSDAFVSAAAAIGRPEAPREPALDRAWIDVLAAVPLFSSLSRRHLRHVARLATAVSYEQGETIILREARQANAFYVVLDGEVDVLPATSEVVVLGRGDVFGELALLDGGPRTAAVRARSPVTAMRLKRAPFLDLLRSEPDIALALLRELAGRLRRLDAVEA
jgi:CRP-like cAMP-binding protein